MIGLLADGGGGSGATHSQTDNFCIYVSRTIIEADGTPIRRVQYALYFAHYRFWCERWPNPKNPR